MGLSSTKLAADVRGDLIQFSMGVVSTINREDILDLCDQFDALTAENERLGTAVDALHAQVDDATSEVTTLEWSLSEAEKEIERLRAAAMNLDGYWISDTYDPSTKNITVRLAAFAELRDLLGLKPKSYADE